MSRPGPTISVVIPTYNYAESLPRAVASVYRQLGEQHELIVIDDGSTDATPDVVHRLAHECPTSTRFIRTANGGPAAARNTGIRESRGDYLVFLDADDEMLPDALQKIGEHLAQHPGSRFVIGGHIAQTPDGRQRQHIPGELPASSLARVRGYLLDKSIAVSNGACVMHREIFARAGYPEAFRSSEDIPVFCQALANVPCSVLPEPLAVIHKHDDSLRHQIGHARSVGLKLVEEIFRPERLGPEFSELQPEVELQRCLSLFRTAYLGQDREMAREYFRLAVKRDWRVLFRFAYSRKALRLWLS